MDFLLKSISVGPLVPWTCSMIIFSDPEYKIGMDVPGNLSSHYIVSLTFGYKRDSGKGQVKNLWDKIKTKITFQKDGSN